MHRRAISLLVVSLTTSLVATLTLTAPPAGAGGKQPKPLRILVTNDDGVGAPGISAVVEALRELPNVKVTVVAPAANQSGASSKTSQGELVTTKATTADGYPAIAVTGYPADTIVYAIDQGGMKQRPDLVVSGSNSTQNLSELAARESGTVGAAKAAAARGIPALAVSQGTIENAEPDYASGAKEVVKWVKRHRKQLTPKRGDDVEVILDNLNVPSCAPGTEHRGVIEVPLAPDGSPDIVAPQDCASALEDPPNDAVAFNNGYVTLTELPVPTAPS